MHKTDLPENSPLDSQMLRTSDLIKHVYVNEFQSLVNWLIHNYRIDLNIRRPSFFQMYLLEKGFLKTNLCCFFLCKTHFFLLFS